jgi:hypothetical protein
VKNRKACDSLPIKHEFPGLMAAKEEVEEAISNDNLPNQFIT